MYRQYQEYEHNDSNVKGRIDVAEHIRSNMLFGSISNGKICYVTREYTVDNDINRLILKAFECVSKRYRKGINDFLNKNDEVKKAISFLKSETMDWETISAVDAIKRANKKVVHNIYKAYEPLRITAIAILKRMGINLFQNKKESASGILIYMPGIWEIYLHNEVFTKIENENDTYNGKVYQQGKYEIIKKQKEDKGGKREVKPDYLVRRNGKSIVFDAKYKENWGEAYNTTGKWSDKTREDVFQVLSYMFLFKCQMGGIIFPMLLESNDDSTKQLYYIGAERAEEQIMLFPYAIKKQEEWNKFKEEMEKVSVDMVDAINDLLQEKE